MARRAHLASAAGLLALTLTLTGAFTAAAQTRPPPQPAVLLDIAADPASTAQETDLLLKFSPAAPTFTFARNDSATPAVGFALSTRGNSAHSPAGLTGPLRAISFEQVDSLLSLDLAVGAPSHVAVTPVDAQTLRVSVTRLARAAAVAAAGSAGPAGPLPGAVDRPPGEDGFEVVLLKYADVSEVVGLLTDGLTVKSNDSFTPREPGFGSAGLGAATIAPAAPPPDAGVGDPVGQSVDEAIGIDRRLNAIILKGSPERIARLKAKIAAIDVPVKSVILETIFVELTDTAARNIGLDPNNANSQIAVSTFQTGAYIAPGFPTNKLLSSVSLQAAIYAQVQAGRGRIVSKPRIAAQSGASAKIVTGDALPILTAITLSGVNGVSQQVQYVNVGVTLQIAPRVSADGFVTSHVFCVVSSVTGYSQGYPTISQREAETSATVGDGESFVIGGLTEENELSSKSRIPILGDAPLAGELFRLQKSASTRTNLYIVVTPHIVTAADAAAAAAQERAMEGP